MRKASFSICLMIPISLLVVLDLSCRSKQHEDNSTSGTISARDLLQDVIKDKDEAFKKHFGRKVQVKGTISYIKEFEDGYVAVTLDTGDIGYGVICIFRNPMPEERSFLANLKLRQQVIVKGRITQMTPDTVSLADCQILTTDASTAFALRLGSRKYDA